MNFDSLEKFVDEIRREYGTRDVFLIAEKAGVKIVYASWHPTTFGEFERVTQTITVNRTALEQTADAENLRKKIVAHELGHFFAVVLRLNKSEEEDFARRFAEALTEDRR